jgi:hypothetical protein
MRARLLTALIFLGGQGCSAIGAFSSAPSQPHQIELYHHEVQYKLLGHLTAKACAQEDEYKDIKGTRSPDPRAIGPGYLFERAKYDALERMPTADGMMSIRAKVEPYQNGECVTVTGLAYRIVHVAAVAPNAGPPNQETADEGEKGEEQPARAAPNDQL